MSFLSLIFAIVILVSVYFWLTRSRRAGRSGYRPPRSATNKTGLQRQTQRELLRLTNGNRAVAQRLVDRVRDQNPGRSEQWCWEKAIYDLQRDRRA
ncbi:hypothetical protein [Almyronema epifaneia]|uniref:HEAT repeat domain-containing protein n=1 Tax=Almyronema epifaneia S1 TaxID=2991925 RepID=A0ABW6ICH1_9CYAN